MTNEIVKEYLLLKLRSFSAVDRTPQVFCERFNEEYLPEIMANGFCDDNEQNISLDTARRWMILLGFSLHHQSKNYFVDGHEREDVKQYPFDFLQRFAAYELRMRKLFW